MRRLISSRLYKYLLLLLFLIVPGESHALHLYRLPVGASGVFTAQDTVHEEIGQADSGVSNRGMDQSGRYVYHAGLIDGIYFAVVAQMQFAFPVEIR